MNDDTDRAAILARRRRFVALSLAGLTGPSCAAVTPPTTTPDSSDRASTEHRPVYMPEAASKEACERRIEPEPESESAPGPRVCLNMIPQRASTWPSPQDIEDAEAAEAAHAAKEKLERESEDEP